MSGPGRPGYTAKVKLIGVTGNVIAIDTNDVDLLRYLSENGEHYVASFTPVGHSDGTESSEAPTS